MFANPLERLQEEPIVGAGPGDVRDPPVHTISRVITEPAAMAVRALRPITQSRRPGGSPVPGLLIASMSRWIASPAGMSLAATRLLRATAAVPASSGSGR